MEVILASIATFLTYNSYCPNMPKEQVRKRGKRKAKHVEEEKRDVPGEGVVDNAQQRADSPGPSTTGAAAAAGASAAASAGIHPSRLALLKGGHRPSAPAPGPSAQYGPPQTEHLDANGAGAVTVIGGEDPENGEAQWIRGPRIESEFPFGELDPDLKGYFKTVEEQVKDWEGTDSVGEEREGECLPSCVILDITPADFSFLQIGRLSCSPS